VFLLVPEYVKALLIILMNDPLSIPMSLPQLHCIFCSRTVKLYFLAIRALWQRKTSPGPILSYFQSLFLQAAQRITSTLIPGVAHNISGITILYALAQ
jgi:hypothetical protein